MSELAEAEKGSKETGMKITTPSLELLESRIAPAALVKNVLSYKDADGFEVDIKFTTKAALQEANFTFDTAFDSLGPQLLEKIDLSAADPLLEHTAIAMSLKVPKGTASFSPPDVGEID